MSSRRKTLPLAPTSAIDQALAALARSDAERSLRWAVAALDDEGAGAPALDLLGRAAAVLGERALAAKAFRAGARALGAQAMPSHAVAAALSARKMGADGVLAELAAAFGAGDDGGVAEPGSVRPPPLVSEEVRPVAPDVDRKALVALAARGVERAAAALPAALPRRPRRTIWGALPPGAFERFADALTIRVFPEGARVLSEGEPGTSAFILARGEVRVTRGEDVALAVLGADAVFGEMAMLTAAPRVATVTTLRPSLVLEMPREAVAEAAREVPALPATLAAFCHRRLVQNLLRASPILAAVPPERRAEIVALFTARDVAPGEVLVAEGAEGAGLHLLATGRVEVRAGRGDDARVLATLGPGDCVGEVSLVLRRPATTSAVAVEPTVALVLAPERFLPVVQSHPELLATLYALAVARAEEWISVVARESLSDDDVVMV